MEVSRSWYPGKYPGKYPGEYPGNFQMHSFSYSQGDVTVSSRGYTEGGPLACLALQAVCSRSVGRVTMTVWAAETRLGGCLRAELPAAVAKSSCTRLGSARIACSSAPTLPVRLSLGCMSLC